ncbi:MAG: fibronectin type III domain-containing protein [Spirochaetes bacterium]|nr:fibronectin type III domain-containing protein [Spirochaetota bacterium]
MSDMKFATACTMFYTMVSKYLRLLILLSAVAFFSGCKLPISTGGPMEIVVKGEQFTLAWDAGGPEIPDDPGRAVEYDVYYRAHGSVIWRLVANVKNKGKLEYVVSNKNIAYGRYDFAVSAVNKQGKESRLHSSLDRTAKPFCGWYINWIGSK